VAGDRAAANAFGHHQGVEELDEAAHRAVRFVAVHVDQLAVVASQFNGAMDGLLAQLAPFEQRAGRAQGTFAAAGVHVVQVSVGIHVRREQQMATQVDLLLCFRQRFADLCDDAWST